MHQQDLAAGIDEDRGVEEPLARPLDKPGNDEYPLVASGLGEAIRVGAGDGLGKRPGTGIGPSEVHALGEDDKAASSCGGLMDTPHGPVQVRLGPAAFNQDLGHPDQE
jgi:hypothetical protein